MDVEDPGVAGPEPRGNVGSEFCRSLEDRPNRSPKLFLPVEIEVLVEGRGGVGSASSVGAFRRELIVDDLPRSPSLARVGDDLLLDAVDPCLNNGTPGPANVEVDFTKALGEGARPGERGPL